jgi:hypothetical protein
MTISLESQGITITLKRILELLEGENEDDYGIIKPTDYAFKTVLNLVSEAYNLMGSCFPRASASTDDEGGISLDWTSLETEGEVSLFCPFSPDKKAYIYHETSDEYAVDYDVCAANLAHWLQWLNNE